MNMHAARAAFGFDSLKTILGISVLAIRWDDAIALLNRLVAERRFTKVSFLNAHNANIARIDPVFAEALDDFLILPDGIGVDLAAKILYGAPFPDNLNGTDFVPAFLQASTRPLTVGLLGATRVNAEAASVKLAALAVQHNFVVIHRPDRGAAAGYAAGRHGRAAPGTLDRAPYRRTPLHHAGRGRRAARFPERLGAARAAVDAPPAPGMAVPVGGRAGPALAPLRPRQSGVPVAGLQAAMVAWS
jgi:hypothetical protein